MKERSILHIDMNNFYASVECLYNPALRDVPMAVGGDPEQRHGIVLAKNYIAKAWGVQTGQALWEARQKCPKIVFVPPHYDRYLDFSKRAYAIYQQYTDQVEPFGLDENWLDVTGSQHLFGAGPKIADDLRERVKKELGITASVGVSYNKVFSKLGSDMKKPDATTVITQADFRSKVWPLPVGELLYVGRATQIKMRRYGIMTIGDLARAPREQLQFSMGKIGLMLWQFANGYDTSPVSISGVYAPIKSVGNSTTTYRDLTTEQDVKITLYLLAESVAARLREHGLACRTVQISIRDNQLQSFERQAKLIEPACISAPLAETALQLFRANVPGTYAIRSLGVRGCDLVPRDQYQMSLLSEYRNRQQQEEIERAIDKVRARYGHYSVQRGIMLLDRRLSGLNPKDDHIIHPIGFLK